MTMLYSFHENFEFNDTETHLEIVPTHSETSTERKSVVRLFSEKLIVPDLGNLILRPRLIKLLDNSSRQFGATLILGRAGTGKTSLAAEFARKYKEVVWYSIDSSDNSWEVFQQYFATSLEPILLKEKTTNLDKISTDISPECISYFIENIFARISESDSEEPRLIVIDNTHYIFDCDWFTDFFHTLVNSLLPNTHLLAISRCKPPLPLWRLRSKQVLGVIDEDLLAFNCDEIREYFDHYGFPLSHAKRVYEESFGRISKLKKITESIEFD